MTAVIVKDFGFWSVALVTSPPTGKDAEHYSRVGAHFWHEYNVRQNLPRPPHTHTYGAFWAFPILTRDLPDFHTRLESRTV